MSSHFVKMWLSMVIVLGSICDVFGYPSGAPTGACTHMTPSHGASAQSSTAPYSISAGTQFYSPGEELTVTVTGNSNSDTMQGFFIQARQNFTNAPTDSYGSFSVGTNAGLKVLTCGSGNANAITHSARFGNAQSKMFKWTAPASDKGNISFIGTIVKEKVKFWTMVTSDTIVAISPTTTPEMTSDTSPTGSSSTGSSSTESSSTESSSTVGTKDCEADATCGASALSTSAIFLTLSALMALAKLAV